MINVATEIGTAKMATTKIHYFVMVEMAMAVPKRNSLVTMENASQMITNAMEFQTVMISQMKEIVQIRTQQYAIPTSSDVQTLNALIRKNVATGILTVQTVPMKGIAMLVMKTLSIVYQLWNVSLIIKNVMGRWIVKTKVMKIRRNVILNQRSLALAQMVSSVAITESASILISNATINLIVLMNRMRMKNIVAKRKLTNVEMVNFSVVDDALNEAEFAMDIQIVLIIAMNWTAQLGQIQIQNLAQKTYVAMEHAFGLINDAMEGKIVPMVVMSTDVVSDDLNFNSQKYLSSLTYKSISTTFTSL
jgi:hypothetical protein